MLDVILIGMTDVDGTLVFRSDLRHSLTGIMCGQFNHEIVYHRLFVTSPFMKQFVRGVPDKNVSWSRVTRICLILVLRGKMTEIRHILISWDRATKRRLTLFSWNRATDFALRCFHGLDCQRLTLKSVTSLMRLGALVKGSSQATSCLATPRLPEEYYKDWTRHRPFDHTSPCSGRPVWTSQICAIGWQHLPWTSHFCKLKTNLVSFLGWTQAANLNRGSLTEGAALTVLRRQSLRSFTSDGWPKWAEPPEREWNQVMLAALSLCSVKLPLFILFFNHSLTNQIKGAWLFFPVWSHDHYVITDPMTIT